MCEPAGCELQVLTSDKSHLGSDFPVQVINFRTPEWTPEIDRLHFQLKLKKDVLSSGAALDPRGNQAETRGASGQNQNQIMRNLLSVPP